MLAEIRSWATWSPSTELAEQLPDSTSSTERGSRLLCNQGTYLLDPRHIVIASLFCFVYTVRTFRAGWGSLIAYNDCRFDRLQSNVPTPWMNGGRSRSIAARWKSRRSEPDSVFRSPALKTRRLHNLKIYTCIPQPSYYSHWPRQQFFFC